MLGRAKVQLGHAGVSMLSGTACTLLGKTTLCHRESSRGPGMRAHQCRGCCVPLRLAILQWTLAVVGWGVTPITVCCLHTIPQRYYHMLLVIPKHSLWWVQDMALVGTGHGFGGYKTWFWWVQDRALVAACRITRILCWHDQMWYVSICPDAYL